MDITMVWRKGLMAIADLNAVEQDVSALDIREVAGKLEAVLGCDVMAYIGGLEDEEALHWESAPDVLWRDDVSMRLRAAYAAAQVLGETYSREETLSWFMSRNSYFDGEGPARVLHGAKTPEDVRDIPAAALGYVWPTF